MDYLNDNHGKYPDQGKNGTLYNWVFRQRTELGPFLDTKLQVDAVTKQRIDILKKDGFVFEKPEAYKDASVNQAVIKFSIIDRLFVKEYNTMGEAARQNNITNKYGVSQWLAAWMDPATRDRSRSLACHNMIFRSKDSLPPYSSE